MVYLPVSKHPKFIVSTAQSHEVDMVFRESETKSIMKGGIHNDSKSN